MEKTKNKHQSRLIFFLIVVLLYIISFLVDSGRTEKAVMHSLLLIVKILPVLVLVFLFMGLINFFIRPSKYVKLFGKESGLKGWAIALVLGVISHGSVYVWYPMLGELQEHGMRPALTAAFIYSRSIKIPLLPMMILYFGWKYTVIFIVYILIASVFEGFIMEKLMTKKMDLPWK
ncbi:permease [bacterium]|nr:permease [bacterium]